MGVIVQHLQVHSLLSELLDTICYYQGDSAQIRHSNLMQVKVLLFTFFVCNSSKLLEVFNYRGRTK